MLSSTALASLAMARAAGERGRLERPEQVWGELAGGGWRPVLERERLRGRERGTDRWVLCHVASISAKPTTKIAQWPNLNSFKRWMVKDYFWFYNLMAKIKPRQ